MRGRKVSERQRNKQSMTESAQTKIFMLLAAPFIILANWAFAWMASQFAWWSWAEPVIFYGLGATGTIMAIVTVIVVLIAPKGTV